ncbi:C2_domain_in_Dock180_and_Zizimin_proteins_-_putative [Leishmania major strain Friedlin]|nr:C2_domain_in_Dock180_and_Zizimin_proteins_-_putative [Leishmania major strain Friedlin]
MSTDNDIERQIMMEMEAEISRSRGNRRDPYTNPPSFELSFIEDDPMEAARKAEVDRIQCEIEERLRRKQQQKQRDSLELSPNCPADKGEMGAAYNLLQHPQNASWTTGAPDRHMVRASLSRESEENEQAEDASRLREDEAAMARTETEEEAHIDMEVQVRRAAEIQALREAEEQARREAEEQARREAEEQARREAEEQARREAEEQARRVAEEQARRVAEEQARRVAEEQARRVAEEQARREAEEQARRVAEEQARRVAEEQARRVAEEQARREAEEQARRVAEEQARREAEEQARREAEEQARRVAEEQARREAEEQARREAEEQARREAEEQARREAEEQARREAEEQARREAEEQARREAEEQARREAEEQARREAEEQARREAEEQARREAEEQARREAEEQARREAEEQARREAEEQARREAEEQARREAEEQARREAEEQARREAEEQARREAEEQARREAEEQARREAEEQARRVAEEQARRVAEEQARREAEEQARREAEEQARREAEEQARRVAEEQARRVAEEQARREAEEQARREAEEQARREAEEQARRVAEEQARRVAEEQARRVAEEQARREAEEQARREAEEQARRVAEEQARREAEEQARRVAEEQARRVAEEQARREAEEQARREAEEQARREAEEQARRVAEEQARRVAEEQARREAEEQARREAEEQARREAEEQARRVAEEQARRVAEEQARREAEEQARREAEEQARRVAEEQARREAEEQARRVAEEQARCEAEEQARRVAEEQARRVAEEQARREAEEQARRVAEEQARCEAEEQARRVAEEQARRVAEEQARRVAEEQARREAEEQARRVAEEQARREAEEQARRVAEEQARCEAEEQARRVAEEQARRVAEEQARRVAEEQARREAEEQHSAVAAFVRDADERPASAVSVTHRGDARWQSEYTEQGGTGADAEEEHGMQQQDSRCSRYRTSSPSVSDCDMRSEGSTNSKDSASQTVSRYSLATLEAIRNDNGILSRTEEEVSYVPRVTKEVPLENFEVALSAELKARGLTEDAIRRSCIEVHRYGTIRESGKCLFPPREVTGEVPAHVKVQLGFFSAKQTIIALQRPLRKPNADRERPCEPGERSLSTLKCYFESEVLSDHTLTVDDEDYPHNAPTERLLTKAQLMRGDSAMVRKAVSQISYGDPIQVWERAQRNTTAAAEAATKSTAANLWVSDIDTRKPIPAMRTFTGGFVYCIEATKISNRVIELHGASTDPLVIAAALYSWTDRQKVKVSETFYFDSELDIFYPQKERSELAKTNQVVVFVPNEFKGTLHLVMRVYRPCCEDYDNYVDLYSRADRYKQIHVAPMKQETLLLTQVSDVLEELGWNSVPLQDEANHLLPRVAVDRLYRKAFADEDVFRVMKDERWRGAQKALPVDMVFSVSDLSRHEVAFPSDHPETPPEENESKVSLLDPDLPGARPVIYRYSPCCIPILNSGYFTTYNNVYYFSVSKLKVMYAGFVRNIPASHHTYVFQLCVKAKDDGLSEEGAIRCIYGRGLSNLSMETTAWSSSAHTSNDMVLNDEFKLQLPLNLSDRHHIFMTLYATCQRKTPPTPGQPRMFKIGYAAVPLMMNGVVQVRDSIDIKFVSHDQATVAAAGGYLTGFAEAPVNFLLNNGEGVVKASTQTKTTVHASNRVIASVFQQCPSSIAELRKNDKVLDECGALQKLPAMEVDPHRNVISLIAQLPLAEILAFYPFLSAYAFSLIGTGSATVSLANRIHMLDVLLGITSKAQQYDTSAHTIRRRHNSEGLTPQVFAKTSVGSILYHFLSNDTLYEGAKCEYKRRLYSGMVEAWLNLLKMVEQQPNGVGADTAKEKSDASAPSSSPASPASLARGSKSPPPARNILREMSNLSWFLFDTILRSIYLWGAENPTVPRQELFHSSFYTAVAELCILALSRLSTFDESQLVRHVAIFVRSLMHYADRGRVLMIYERIAAYFEEDGNLESLTNFLKYVLEDPDAIYLLLHSAGAARPVFLTRIVVHSFTILMINPNRVTRSIATDVLYSFLRRLANDSGTPSENLTCIAAQLFELVRNLGPHWKAITQPNDKIPIEVFQRDKQQLSMTCLWILYYTPRSTLQQWLQEEVNEKVIAGIMQIVAESQSTFRYTAAPASSSAASPFAGVMKDASNEEVEERRAWEARSTTFVTAIGTQMCSFFLNEMSSILRTVRDNSPSAAVFPFFVMLESVLNLGNSTISLQMSSAAMHEVVCKLFPEIISRKARMGNGMALLTFRLMSSCCQYVRSSASCTFLLMSQAFFSWKNSLSKIRSLTANALVSVAESRVRDLRLAGRFIEFQFDELIERAKVEEANYTAPSCDFASRYEDDSNAPGGDAQMKYRQKVEGQAMSVQRNLPISRYLLEKSNVPDQQPPRFSSEFTAMTVTVLSLFDDVLRLQMDDSMKFKEAKATAYFEVFRNFLRQNALKEALKWLYRLHDVHRANNDYLEAGMVLVFIAALCFRVTEVFYFVKGNDSKGARMPFEILSHVFWHDYVRILPEVDALLPADTVYAIVSELYTCPEDMCFSMEGQVKALKEAAEFQDKGQYYEYSLQTINIANKYLMAASDFKGSSVVHMAMSTWCTAIAEPKSKRHNSRYFFLWARMERHTLPKSRKELHEDANDIKAGEKPRGLPNGNPIRRIYKMPTTTTLEEFKNYARSYVESLFFDTSLVLLTHDLTETLPALPEPDSKRKRVAAVHRQPNHCMVTVSEVQPYFAKGTRVPPDGFDRAMHISYFENTVNVGSRDEVSDGRKLDLMAQRMSVSTYELERSFPSTTSAIDIAKTHQVLLNPFETAEEMLNSRREAMNQAPVNDALITVIRKALSPKELPPGAYMKEVIAVMGDHPEVIHAVRALSTLARAKLEICEKMEAMVKNPEDYALVLKAVTDIECCLVAMQHPDEDDHVSSSSM